MIKNLEINKTCISCDSCRLICPENSIITDGQEYAIDSWSCTQCGLCIEVCPVNCIKFTSVDNRQAQ